MSMQSNLIRKMALNGLSSSVREILLTSTQLELLKRIGKGEMSSHCLSLEADITVANASTQLKNLYRKGYLNRREASALTGGIICFYVADPLVIKELEL